MDELRERTVHEDVSEVVHVSDVDFDVETDVLIAGGGGTGLVAALAACEREDLTVTVLEKAPELGGNTSLSTGMLPAAGTRFQRAAGIEETPADMAADILSKNDHEADEELVNHLCRESPKLVHWLVDDWEITLDFVDDFTYPKHSEYRMHAPPGRNGANLIEELAARAKDAANVEVLPNSPVISLVTDGDGVVGVLAGEREEAIATERVVLATDGFGGNRRMIREHCDEDIERALYFGADGNTGDGIRFGAELGGELAYMDAYQGHATVAHETGALSTYAVVMNGGVLVNERGERFGDETAGYSAFAIDVLRQPGGVAYEVFDERIHDRLEGAFDDFDEAVALGAYDRADDVASLAETLGCDPEATANVVEAYNDAARTGKADATGRSESMAVLEPPYYGTKVTGALFHTQGGLVVDEHARVQRADGSVVPNLYAGGGTTAGLSGHGAGGYLSGNGLTSALGLGRLAGVHARDSI